MYIQDAQQQPLFPAATSSARINDVSSSGTSKFKSKQQTSESTEKEVIYTVPASDWISLRVLFLRHMQQQRWIYFLHQELSIKTNSYPVLQVKLNNQQKQFDAIQKIVHFGQAGAIIVERPVLTEEQLAQLTQACLKQNVILVLLENHLELCH
ncbi:MAG: hypothetical protein ACFHVJ_15315 [Aestuariibacter sp.]